MFSLFAGKEKPGGEEAGTPQSAEVVEDLASERESEQGNKRSAPAAGAPAKKTRYDGKLFNELTVAELESIVKEAVSFQKQVAAKDEELTQLREMKAEKVSLAKQNKVLETDLAATKKELDKAWSAVKTQGDDVTEQALRIKKVIRQQVMHQMAFLPVLKDHLQNKGQEITVFVANVTPDMLKALGLEQGSKSKYADVFFGALPAKNGGAPPGLKMQMARNMTFKYTKATGELRMDGFFKLVQEGRRTSLPKKAARKKDKKDDAQEEEQGEEEEEGGGGGEEDADEEGADGEGGDGADGADPKDAAGQKEQGGEE